MAYDPDKFAQDRYDHEASRRGELTSALALPLGVVSALLGALVVVVRDLHWPFEGWSLFQACMAAVSALACVVSAYFLVRSYFNYTYRYVVTPKVLNEYRARLIQHYLATGKTDSDAKAAADADTHSYIQERYAESAHHNTENNDRKSSFLHRANGAMITAACLAAVSALPYVVAGINASPKVPKVEVTNIKELLPMTTTPAPATDRPAPPPPPPPAVVKPEPPPDRFIKESEDPTKIRRSP